MARRKKGKGKGKSGWKGGVDNGAGRGKDRGKNMGGKNGRQGNPKEGSKGEKAFGYQGTCFKCHAVGHKAWECQSVEEEENEEEEEKGQKVECGSVWMTQVMEGGQLTNLREALDKDGEKSEAI